MLCTDKYFVITERIQHHKQYAGASVYEGAESTSAVSAWSCRRLTI